MPSKYIVRVVKYAGDQTSNEIIVKFVTLQYMLNTLLLVRPKGIRF